MAGQVRLRLLIEDKVTPRALTAAGKPCLSGDEARMKVRAAVAAAQESGILVMARTDCRPTQGIEGSHRPYRDVRGRGCRHPVSGLPRR